MCLFDKYIMCNEWRERICMTNYICSTYVDKQKEHSYG